MKNFNAPWCSTLHIVSWTVTALCIIASVAGASTLRRHGLDHLVFGLRLLPLAIIGGCALFTVRGYTITPDAVFVRRLFWHTSLPRAEIVSAAVDPAALKWALRTFGIGGMYSFSGCYWNRRLGHFRAYVTDPKLCVMIKFKARTVVISPDKPETFVKALGLPTSHADTETL